ncbi:alpha-galactosidase [Rosa sericea]
MNIFRFLFSYLCFFLTGSGPRLSSHIKRTNFEQNSIHNEDGSRWVDLLNQRVWSQELASTPPRGWNSYNAISWTITEEEFLQNAEIISKKLLPHGYEYVVVDHLWYRRNVTGASVDSLGVDVIDEWGRPMPDPDRWPSSRGGKGFTEVADRVHKMGLKFGISVMRGINTQAVKDNTHILDPLSGNVYDYFNGKIWTAQDIGIKERTCARMQNGFMSVDTTLQAGRFFLADLYQLYANWGVDFVKQDCVFGNDLDMNEIYHASWLLRNQRPILYSVSPGIGATPMMAKSVSSVVNMYSINRDDWDDWGDVVARFDVARDFAAANMIGANSSWPDLDMLPLGWLIGSNEGPHRMTNLTLEEQRTMMTLWCMAKSPLMFGGDVRKLDDTTYSLLTNPTLLEINSFSSNNKEFPYIKSEGLRSWVATGRQGEIYIALFNLDSKKTTITAQKSDLAKALPGTTLTTRASCKGKEVWSQLDLGIIDHSISIAVETHGTALVVLHCN